MRYVLKDLGYPYKTIMCKRKAVGRVYRHVDGRWIGMIGKDTAEGHDEITAFHNVAAKALGYDTVEDLRAHNSDVRMANKARRARADAEMAKLLGPEIMNMMRGLR